MPSFPAAIKIVEVGPRDGLQNEKTTIPTAAKLKYIALLNDAGFTAIEATSFVSPKAIPQLADAVEVYSHIEKKPGVAYSVLVPNMRGMERALTVGVREIAVFTAASESFTQANIHATIDESIGMFQPVIKLALAEGIRVRGYVSTAFGCPYEGQVAEDAVVAVTGRLFELGVAEVSIGDTIGVATPNQVYSLLPKLIDRYGVERLALHFHDTRGTALANVLAGLELGIQIFDTASGGVGGCPYAPGAAGNVATEDVIYMLHGMNIQTGVDLAKVVTASQYLSKMLGRSLSSKYFQAAIANQ